MKKLIAFEDDVILLVEDWRKQQTKIPSFNEAVNTMLRVLMHPSVQERLKR
jgi:hypothetical protein